jgi:uncharacterized protein (TIGR02266 family)
MLIDRSFAEILSHADDPAERRATPRFPVATDVTVGGHGRVLPGVTRDVSAGGLFVATDAAVPVGTRVSLRLRLPVGAIVGTGIVRWGRDAGPGRDAGLGIALAELDEADRSLLQRFCSSHPPRR